MTLNTLKHLYEEEQKNEEDIDGGGTCALRGRLG